MGIVKDLLIVGASRGLGLELTRVVLGQGGRVTAVAHGSSAGLDALLREHADRLRVGRADVRSESELENVAKSLDTESQFDALIYNAAIHLEGARPDIELASPEDMLKTLDVNAVGAARVAKHFRRFMAPTGLLALISSEAGSIEDAGRASEYGYCMSKAALNMLAKLLANREERQGSKVQVIAIHPGWMRTDMGGPNADISAEEAARDIVRTLEARLQSPGPPFIDRQGKALAW